MDLISVPEGYVYIVEHFGRYKRTLKPGLRALGPFDKVAYRIPTKDIRIEVPLQPAITRDNVPLLVSAVTFIRIENPRKAIYEIDDFYCGILKVIQTTLRAIIGELSFDDALLFYAPLKDKVMKAVSDEIAGWGVSLKSIDIQDIRPSKAMCLAMEEQASAERHRRATITLAKGDAMAMTILAEADNEALEKIAKAAQNGDAVTLHIGKEYLRALKDVSNSQNAKIVVMPADISAAVKQTIAAYDPNPKLPQKTIPLQATMNAISDKGHHTIPQNKPHTDNVNSPNAKPPK